MSTSQIQILRQFSSVLDCKISDNFFWRLDSFTTSCTWLHQQNSVHKVVDGLQLEGNISICMQTENFWIFVQRQLAHISKCIG